MHQDLPPREASVAIPASFPEQLLTNVSDGATHDILEFLARPTIVSTGTWSNSQTVASNIAHVNFPSAILTALPAFSSKISGFLGFRATTVFTLQVNANRFQQGRLFLMFFPQSNIMQAKYYTVSQSLTLQTQLPRIDFDANTDTQVQLRIPYVSPQLCFDTTVGTGDVGSVDLIVYDVLNSASSELSAEFTIWAHFEDVRLFYPTISNSTYVPQMGVSGRKMKAKTIHGSEVTREEENIKGPLSNSFGAISKAAMALSDIPMLSSVMGTASWVSAVASKTASSFGFSKPMNNGTSMVVMQVPHRNAVTVNGAVNTKPMALQDDNHVETLTGIAGTDLDEMAFSHMISIPAWFRTVTWQDSVTPLNVLFSYPLRPNLFSNLWQATPAIYAPTPVNYVSSLFKYYRGSFKFKIKLVKTEFHTGRLAFIYLPGYQGQTPPAITNANMAYLHKDIVDIRTAHEIEFTCPYASTIPYLDVSVNYGYLICVVINQLRHPDTVIPFVNMLVEVAADSDFEFSVPQNPGSTPVLLYTAATPQMLDFDVEPQGADIDVIEQVEDSQEHLPATLIGTAGDPHDGLISSAACVGERILSWRQMVKRATLWRAGSVGTASTEWSFAPYANTVSAYGPIGGTPAFTKALNSTDDYFTWAINCFAYLRGGVNIRLYNGYGFSSGISQADLRAGIQITAGTYTIPLQAFQNTVPGAQYSLIAPHTMPASVYPSGEFNIPYYNSFHCGLCVGDFNTNNYLTFYRPVTNFLVRSATATLVFPNVTRTAADDFSTHFFTGTPMLAFLTSLTSASAANTFW